MAQKKQFISNLTYFKSIVQSIQRELKEHQGLEPRIALGTQIQSYSDSALLYIVSGTILVHSSILIIILVKSVCINAFISVLNKYKINSHTQNVVSV